MHRPFALVLALVPLTGSAQEYWGPEERIEESVSLQLTDEGLDQLGAAAALLVPDLLGDALGDLTGDEIAGFTDIRIGLEVDRIAVDPKPRRPATIDITVDAVLDISDSVEPARGDLIGCPVEFYAADIPATITLRTSIAVISLPDGSRGFNVDLSVSDIEIFPDQGDISIDSSGGWGCDILTTLIDALANILVANLPAALSGTINETLDGLEPDLEEALGALNLSEELELLGKTLALELQPKQVFSSADGLDIQLSSLFYAPVEDKCFDDVDPGGGLKTDTPVPPVSALPRGTQLTAFASDDLLHQAVYAAGRGGLLCLTVDKELLGDSLPLELDTSLISLFGGEGYDVILPETKPIVIETKPNKLPTVRFDGPKPITAEIRDFGLNFMGDLDFRTARLVAMEVDADVGVGLTFDGTTGDLGIDLNPDDLELRLEVVPDVLVAGSESGFVDGLGGLVDQLVGPLLGDALGDPLFTLPSFEGIGVVDIALGPGGAQGDWLALDAEMGPVTYGSEDGGLGCGDEGGDEEGCGGGCSSSGGRLAGGLGLLLPLWALRRRRRD